MNETRGRTFRGWPLGLVVAGGIVVAGWLRLRLALNRELWLDESHSALLARMPLGDLLQYVRGDVHPPGYFLALNLWARAFGDSEGALRSFSMIAVALATLGIFRVARNAFGPWYAALASLLFGLSPVLVFYGTEVRMYALTILWAVLTLVAYQKLLADPASTRGRAVSMGLLGALTFLTHYIGLFFLGGLYLHWAYQVLRRRLDARRLLLAGAVTTILAAPWAPVLIEQRTRKENLRVAEQAAHADPTALSFGVEANPDRPVLANLRALVENGASILGVYPADHRLVLAVLAVPFVIVVGLLVASAVAGGIWSELALIGVATTAAAGLGLGFTARRFLLLVLPLVVLGVVEGLVWLRDRGRPRLAGALAAAVVGLTAGGAVHTAMASAERPLAAMVRHLESHYQPDDLIVFNALYSAVPFDYQARQLGFRYRGRGFPVDAVDWWQAQPFKGWGGPVIHRSDLARFVSESAGVPGRTVWLILFETKYYDPGDELLGGLQRVALKTEQAALPEIASSGYRLFRFEF